MIAANQGGQHNNGRSTFGHSMIVGPWGDVLSSLDIDNGIALATFKKSELNKVRTSLPAIQHRRL
jgi:nitrilase